MNRRDFCKGLALAGFSSLLPYTCISQAKSGMILRKIPASGEQIPVIGMGSWLTFDVKGNKTKEKNMKAVLSEFYRLGGRVIDSSPMYGSSEEVIAKLARELGIMEKLWVSTKIWTDGKVSGQRQLNTSRQTFQQRVMVNHVHNMRDLKTHFRTLQEAKAAGLIKYTAMSHYLNSNHERLGKMILDHKPDFIQVNYNIENPKAAKKLIPLAQDQGVAVIINRPFQTGGLFRRIGQAKLPGWAAEWEIDNWAAYMLKYIISQPGVTCVIPATTQVKHVQENMAAGRDYIPTKQEREKMREYFITVI